MKEGPCGDSENEGSPNWDRREKPWSLKLEKTRVGMLGVDGKK